MPKARLLRAGDRSIGPGQPVFVIAEAGINHNGSLKVARRLVKAAAEAGADAVKFQRRNMAHVYEKSILAHPNQGEQKYQYLIPLLQEFQLSDGEYKQLEKYAAGQGVMFLVSPWDKVSARDIEQQLNIPLYKIGSPDLTNDELLEYVAGFNKPMIVSTGMSEEREIEHAVGLLRRLNASLALLHCSNVYPAPFDEINLKYMGKLKKYGAPVGYSGHERGIAVSIAAAARGACIIERHITMDKKLEGPDHRASLEPDEFRAMVDGIRQAGLAFGDGIKRISRAEVMNREILGKSVVAATFIPDGAVIRRDMLAVRSPAKGLSPQRISELEGVTVQRDIFTGEPLTEDDLEAESVVKEFDGGTIPWRWGPVVRWHDFRQYLKYEPKVFEFHLSDKDLDEEIPRGSFTQEVIVHAPEYMHRTYLNPAAEDKEEREVALETLRRTARVARRLGESFAGTPKVVVHPGGITLRPAAEPGKLLDIFADTLQRLDAEGVEILPENLPPRPWVFGGEWTGNIFLRGEEIKKFLQDAGSRMCFDVSHAALACNVSGLNLEEMTQTLGPFISHLHLSDAAGIGDEGLQIGEGKVDWAAVMPALAGFKGTVVPEIWQGHLHGGRGFLQALEHLKQYMK